MVRNIPTVSNTIMRQPLLRELALAIPISVGSRRMPASDALRAASDLAASTAFEETFANTRAPFCGQTIAASVPVTVAFGTRDWIVPARFRHRATLPPHTRWIDKAGWGHVPMWVDPIGVSTLILDSTQ